VCRGRLQWRRACSFYSAWARLLFEEFPRASTDALAQPETSTALSHLPGPTTASCLTRLCGNQPASCTQARLPTNFSRRAVYRANCSLLRISSPPLLTAYDGSASPHLTPPCHKRHASRGAAPPTSCTCQARGGDTSRIFEMVLERQVVCCSYDVLYSFAVVL
jgi:hypothetical protein